MSITCAHMGVFWKDCACPACGAYNVDGRNLGQYALPTATMKMLLALLGDEKRIMSRPWDYGGYSVQRASAQATRIHNEITARLAKKIGSDKVFEWGDILLSMQYEALLAFDEDDRKALAEVMPQVSEAIIEAMKSNWALEVQRIARQEEEKAEAERLRREKFHPKKSHRFAQL